MSRARTLQLSVTEFSVPCPRLGSLESDAAFGVLPQVGPEIHQDIQAERLREGGAYVPEKWITHTFSADPFKVTVSGRMDGFQYGSPSRIDEIKSTYNPDALLERLKDDPFHPYRMQLRTYGYIQYKASGTEPELCLLVVCARTRKRTEWIIDLAVQEYEDWLKRRLSELIEQEKMFEALKVKRRKSAQTMNFPFAEPRPGQKELIHDIETHLSKNARLLLQAPTGLGKTAGVLFPVLKESLGRGQRTIYVTAKNSQHGVAEDAVERLQSNGCKVKSVTIHAKSKMCLKEEVLCNPTHCEFAREYYTKLRTSQIVEKLAKKKRLTEESFKEAGREFEVCPFELQLELVPRADVVVCDYNYVFSPRNILGRLTQNGYSGTTPPNLVIDEAHNLATRANGYYSSEISVRAIRSFVEKATYLPENLWVKIKSLGAGIEGLFQNFETEGRSPRRVEPVSLRFDRFEAEAEELMRAFLESETALRSEDPVLGLCNQVLDFAEAARLSGDEFLFTYTPEEGGRLRVTCCDSSKKLAERYPDFANVVAFSATLKPFEFHLRTLGLDPQTTFTEEFKSPFPADHRKILIIPQVSTKWRDRENNYGKIRDVIEKVAALRPGNYFVFFPSFDFLNRVADLTHPEGFRVVRQERDMNRRDVDRVLELLREAETPTIVFAVQGGVFSEGIDYPGRMIIGALIVGPALPTFDFEREELRRYFDQKGGPGFDYAYTFPAMTRVVQSAGRVIRSPEDRGVIILLDQRFVHENYLKAMPADWLASGREALLSKHILQDISDFWRSHDAE